MELNQTTLRGILAQILSVDNKYIVPKQGNWWNPQENESNIKNWCAYRIKSNRPRTAPFYVQTEQNKNVCTVLKMAEIELQFVGPDSEALANNVALWPMREDVQQAFSTVQGAIMLDDLTATSIFFTQEGANTIYSWNVNFSILWYSQLETTQGRMPFLTLEN